MDRPPPLSVLKCLFALAGDPGPDENGNIVINRLMNDEISRKDFLGNKPPEEGNILKANTLQFSRVSRRQSESSDESYGAVRAGRKPGRYVQQFKFMRLGRNLNYELVALALKGLQMGMSLGSFLTVKQHNSNQAYRTRFRKLLAWGANPQPLTEKEIETFLSPVYNGLITEKRGKPAHTEAYIAWTINQLREILQNFNTVLTFRKESRDR